MLDDSSDPILTTIRRIGLFNSSADRVKVRALARVGWAWLGVVVLGRAVIWGVEPEPHIPHLPWYIKGLQCLERTFISEADRLGFQSLS